MIAVELRDREFKKIASMVYDICRINLQGGKKPLVQGRLAKRLRALNVPSFREYIAIVEDNDDELRTMINCLTTNLTRFYREPEHFNFMRENLIRDFLESGARNLRVWSAGCSSGEEPYTIAIELREHVEDVQRRDVLILATDISSKVLDRAGSGLYSGEKLRKVPASVRSKYFTEVESGGETLYQAKPALKQMIRFRYLNLMDPWPMRKQFDVIFCRNVMIYFDKSTQEDLVNRFWDVVRPGGVLIVGHSESLAAMEHSFRCVSPTVYLKE